MRIETRDNILIILLLFAAAAACYSFVLNAGFLWDDEYLILRNPLLRAPIFSFQIFRQDIVNSNFTYTIYYRPLQILSYAFDYRLGGMDPFLFHLSSVLLHFMNGILVFVLAVKLTREKATAFLAALLFVVHPAQTGAVSYISGRADLLFFFFGFLCMIFYLLFRENGKRLFMAFSVLSLCLSLLSKEAAVIFPFLLVFMDAMVLRERSKARIADYAPYFIVAAAYLGIHHLALGGRYPAVFRPEDLPAGFLKYLSMAREFFTAGIIPLGLQIRKGAGDAAAPLIALITTGLILIWAVLFLKRERRMLLFSVGFFMMALLPLVFVVGHFKIFAGHWMYLASFGVFLFLAVTIRGVFDNVKLFGRIVFAAAIFAAVLFYSGLTIGQNIYWSSGMNLSDRVLAVSAGDTAAMYFKAVSCLERGMKDQSLYIMREYAGINKNDPRAWYLKGRLALAAGETDEAERDFKKAVELGPDYANGRLGLALISLVRGRQDEGIEFLERTIELSPGHSEAYLLLVQVYAQAGENEKAFNAAKKAKRANPYDYNTLINLGTAYTGRGDLRKGAQLYLEASRLYPEKPVAYYNLGYVFYISGQKEEARAWLRKAIMADPGYEPAIKLLRQLGRENF